MSTIVMPIASATAPAAPEPEFTEQPAETVDAGASQDWVMLRRSGKAPYRFKGVKYASSTSYYCGSRLWYEVNIFTKSSGGFVLDLRVFKKSDEDKDLFKIESFDSMEDMFEFLENYDPTEDVSIFFDASEKSISTSDMTLKAVSLRQAIDEASRDYRSLVGDMLYQLYQHQNG